MEILLERYDGVQPLRTSDIVTVCQVIQMCLDLGRCDERQWAQILSGVSEEFKANKNEVVGLLPAAYSMVCTYYKVNPRTDYFATKGNTKCKRFYSARMPGSFGFGAFAFHWLSADMAYTNPPWTLLTRTVEKIVCDEVRLLLITPLWVNTVWYKILIAIAQTPFTLKGRLYIRGEELLDAPTWHTVAWLTDVAKIKSYKSSIGSAGGM
jgi:hypothetical protein